MKTFKMVDIFGRFCGNGTAAKEYADKHIVPILKDGKRVTIDFDDVETVSSSFINSLVFNTYGYGVIEGQVTYETDDDFIKHLIETGIYLLGKYAE